MSLLQVAFTLLLVIDAGRASEGTSIVPVLATMAALDLAVTLTLCCIFMRGGADGGDTGPGGGGPGRRRRPRKPPPAGPAWWPEFERQFADHVAARARTPSQRRDERAMTR